MFSTTAFFGTFIGMIFVIAFYAVVIWAIYKFYKALTRIGDELSEIRQILRSGPAR